MANLARDEEAPAGDDPAIRERILAAFAKQPWAPQINVVVKERRRRAVGHHHRRTRTAGLIVAAENVAGVTEVHDHLVWVEPMSGMAFASPEDEAKARAAQPAQNAVH